MPQAAGQPARLAAGIGGGLLLTAGLGVAADASLQAVGVSLTLAQTAMVGLTGTHSARPSSSTRPAPAPDRTVVRGRR